MIQFKNQYFLYISIAINVILLVLVITYYSKPTLNQNKDTLIMTKDDKILKTSKLESNKSYQTPFTQEHITILDDYIDNGSVLVVDQKNEVLLNLHGHDPFIPASTLKVVTSACALKYLGKDYRFQTEFRLDDNNNLYIKGLGDPVLITDELRLITNNLKNKGLTSIRSIYLDNSYFADPIKISGIEETSEAYDSPNFALVTNFNTIPCKIRRRRGQLLFYQGEKETPLIPYAIKLLNKIKLNRSQKLRRYPQNISLKDEEDSLNYFGHLFAYLCRKKNIKVTGKIKVGNSDKELPLFYIHENSKTLSDVIQLIMEFSNNFTTNQMLLVMGEKVKKEQPATLENGLSVVRQFLKEDIKAENIKMVEGSGISYANRVTAFDMVKVLDYMTPYKDLFKKIVPSVVGKTGGLKTVMSLVGYIDSQKYGELKFAIILNQSTNNRDKILDLLLKALEISKSKKE